MNRQELFKDRRKSEKEEGKQYYFKWIFSLDGRIFEIITEEDSKTEAVCELGRALGIRRTRQGIMNLVYKLKPKLIKKTIELK